MATCFRLPKDSQRSGFVVIRDSAIFAVWTLALTLNSRMECSLILPPLRLSRLTCQFLPLRFLPVPCGAIASTPGVCCLDSRDKKFKEYLGRTLAQGGFRHPVDSSAPLSNLLKFTRVFAQDNSGQVLFLPLCAEILGACCIEIP